MKIYLAGCGIIPKKNMINYYQLFKNRLFSFWEIQPGRFGANQWEQLYENLLSRNSSRDGHRNKNASDKEQTS
jgi:hypothetical protein